jgi:hypothetical protein
MEKVTSSSKTACHAVAFLGEEIQHIVRQTTVLSSALVSKE